MLLGPQNPQIQRIAQISMRTVLASVYFKNAFPDSGEKTVFLHDALYEATTQMEFTEIANRIQKDTEYAEALGTLVSIVTCLLVSVL